MNWLGSLLSGLVRGLSTALMDWWRTRKAEKDRARADSMESAHRGDLKADQAEMEAGEERKKAREKAKNDPLHFG